MRILAIAALVGLAGCSQVKMREAADILHPAGTAQRNYARSSQEYRDCIAANPAPACEGQRNMMESDARVLSSYRPAIIVER